MCALCQFISSSSLLAAYLRDQLRPAVEDRQDLLSFGRGQTHCHAGNTKIAVTPQYGQILRRAAQGHRQRRRVAAGFLGHFAEARHEIIRATRAGAWRCGQNPVAIADRTTRGEAEGAADDHRRVRLLYRFRPNLHRWEIDDLAMILGGILGPDLLDLWIEL